MHYRIPTLYFSILIVVASLSQAGSAAAFGRGDLLRLRWDGFQQCKALEGTSSWHAVASGLLNDGGSGNGGSSAHFRLRTCFERQNDCERFINRIHHHIEGIDELWQARCYNRN